MKVFGISSVVLALGIAAPALSDDMSPSMKGAVRNVFETTTSFSFAEQIASRCDGIALKRGAKQSLDKWVAGQRRKHGFSDPRLKKEIRELPQKYQTAFAKDFLSDNRIDPSKAETFCPAGEKLIASKSTVGNFLKLR